jgi:hypothetical protein
MQAPFDLLHDPAMMHRFGMTRGYKCFFTYHVRKAWFTFTSCISICSRAVVWITQPATFICPDSTRVELRNHYIDQDS